MILYNYFFDWILKSIPQITPLDFDLLMFLILYSEQNEDCESIVSSLLEHGGQFGKNFHDAKSLNDGNISLFSER